MVKDGRFEVIRKNLKSLPERFQPKVTAIKESKNVDKPKVHELVSNLHTYETNLHQDKKFNNTALTSKLVCIHEVNSNIINLMQILYKKKLNSSS